MKIERRKPLNANIGVLGVALDIYWGQFDGLYEAMQDKMNTFKAKLAKPSVSVFDFGIVDNAEKAYAVVPKLRAADLDLLFIDMVTYATSATFGIIAREFEIPIVLVALQPLEALDYANATTFMQLCNDDYCAVPEFTGVAVRMGRPAPPVILGMLENDPVCGCRDLYVVFDRQRSARPASRPCRPYGSCVGSDAGYADRSYRDHCGVWLSCRPVRTRRGDALLSPADG